MKKDVRIDYDSAIAEFLEDVKTWLNQRPVRDAGDVNDVNDTKEMWTQYVIPAPKEAVKYENLYNYVTKHEHGFIVKYAMGDYDTSMMVAVNDVLIAMDKYYQYGGDKEKLGLADAIKNYKMLRAKNAFERLKISLTKSEKLLATKQK